MALRQNPHHKDSLHFSAKHLLEHSKLTPKQLIDLTEENCNAEPKKEKGMLYFGLVVGLFLSEHQ